MLGRLLAHGADMNAEDLNGRSPLHDMVDRNHFEVITEALFYGADPNKADIHGRTALQMAALNGNEDILKVMKQAAAMDETAQQSQLGQERAANAAAYLARFSEPVPAEEIEASRLNTHGREG